MLKAVALRKKTEVDGCADAKSHAAGDGGFPLAAMDCISEFTLYFSIRVKAVCRRPRGERGFLHQVK